VGKLLGKSCFVSFACLLAAVAFGGACHGSACRFVFFGKDTEGCLEIQNTGQRDLLVTVYTAGSGTLTVRVMSGDTQKVYKIARLCVPAADYIRADAEFDGGVFSPSH
jgi:P pilus assembly chaperone PapD